MDINKLKRKVICELHFPSKDTVQHRNRKLLKSAAVPYKYDVNEEPQVPIEQESLAIGQHSKIYGKKHLLTSDSDPNTCNCVYINCSSNVRRNNNLSFFTFPIDDSDRLEEWQYNCGNENIANMEISELKGKVICELHFSPNYIIGYKNRKILKRTAVPYLHDAEDGPQVPPEGQYLVVGQHSKSYGKKHLLTSDSDTDVEQAQLLYINCSSDNLKSASYSKPTQSISDVNVGDLKMELPTKYLPQKIKTVTDKEIYTKKKINPKCTQKCKPNKNKFSVGTVLRNLLIHRSQFVKTFVNMQLYHNRNREWSKSERDLALALYLKSPSTYKFMLYNLQFTLPSEKVIEGWLKSSYLKPGLNKGFMNKLLIKAKTLTRQEKIIAITMDEIRLKPQLEFDSLHDRIEGFENFDGSKKSSKLANTALVFSVTSILHNWKTPLAFYTWSKSINSVSLQTIVLDIIKKLKYMTFNPLVLVCNQESNKIGMLELLGATQENPMVNIQGQKIFTCFNTSHLLNSLKQIFTDTKLQIFINKMPISYTDVAKIYNAEDVSDTQVLSDSLAADIKPSLTGQLVSPTAEYSAQFLENIKCINEALKCRTLHCSASERKDPSICSKLTADTLQKALEYFMSMQIFEDNRLRNDILCIQGFLWTINSILLLQDYLKNAEVKCVLTNFTNLDDLDFLSEVRNKEELNATPTVRQLRTAIQRNIDIQMQMEVKNYEFLNISNVGNDTKVFVERNENTRAESREELEIVTEERLSTYSKSLDTNPMVYVAGYLAYEVIKKYGCVKCIKNLTNTEKCLARNDELLLILSKNYCCDVNHVRHLPKPSDEFSDTVVTLLQVFEEAYDNFKFEENVSKNVYEYLRTYLSQNDPRWSSTGTQGQCTEHLQFILKLFVEMNIVKFVKVESKNYNRTEFIKPSKKIRVLQAELF